jgi:arylsulfatase A-like enzyme
MKGVTVNGSRNDPLRGSKRTTLEGGIRVPFVVAWPGHVAPGVFERPVIQLDLTATALAAAGCNADIPVRASSDAGSRLREAATPGQVNARATAPLDGVNLLPFLYGGKKEAPHDALFWRFGGQMAIRSGDYKLVRYDSNADTNLGKGRQPVTPARLYNLVDDLGEAKDLAAAQPEKVKALQSQWDAWNATLVPPLWGSEGGAARRARDGS